MTSEAVPQGSARVIGDSYSQRGGHLGRYLRKRDRSFEVAKLPTLGWSLQSLASHRTQILDSQEGLKGV